MCTKDTGGTLPHWENVPCDVQWSFGHGLSYTQFVYDDLILSSNTLRQHWHDGEDYARIDDDEQLTVTVTVTMAVSLRLVRACQTNSVPGFAETSRKSITSRWSQRAAAWRTPPSPTATAKH